METQDFKKILQRSMANHEDFAKAFMERPESLSSFLTYDEYVDDLGLFRQKDGSLGVVYEVSLCEHEAKTAHEIVSLLEGLKTWFRLPEEVTLSLLFEQSIISPHDLIWAQAISSTDRSRGDISARLHTAQVDRLRRSGVPMRRTLYLSVRSFEKKASTGTRLSRMAGELGRSHRTLSNEVQDFVRRARAFNHSLSQFELTSPLSIRRINALDLADMLRRTFNPVTYYQRPFAPVNPDLPIADQVIFCPSRIDFPGIEREGITTRTISLKNAPSFAYPGAMAYFLGLDFPFRLCLNISFPSGAAVKRHFALKDFFLQNTPTARARRQKSEVEGLQDRLLRDDRVLKMTFSLFIEGESTEELDRRSQECLARFQQKLECEAIVEKEIGFGLWLNSLPLQYHPIADYTAQRSIRILASDIVQFCPVFDSFRGSAIASNSSLFLSRERGLVPIGLKPVGNSHMVVVLGDTGSGKSGQVIQLLLGELRSDPKPLIFVIDHKTSYGMVSKYLPSELTIFEHAKPLPFSPFRGALDEEKLSFLVKLLTAAIQLTSPNFQVDSEHVTCLSQAIRQAYTVRAITAGVRYVDGELLEPAAGSGSAGADVSIDDIVAQLGTLTGQPEFEKYGQSVEDLAKKLRPFYGDGIHAGFFRACKPSTGSGKLADLYVYDLDALASEPVLQALMTMSVIDDIRRKIKTEEARARGGFIVIEELGMLGRNNPIAKDFVIDAAETFRKLGFYLIPLLPNPREYFETPAGQAVWAVADHFFFLSMKEDNVNFVAEHSDILDEASAQIVKSLKTERGKYADIYYTHKTKTLKGAFRNIPSAHSLWLMPSHRPDALEAERTLAKHSNDPVAALEDLVNRFPEGTTEMVSLPGESV